MNIPSIIAAAVLAFAFLPASAGEVYKCKDAKGNITFTNIKCPEKSAAQHYGSYQATQDSPDQYFDAVNAAAARRAQAQERMSAQQAPMSTAPGASALSPAASGTFECSTRGKTWIQSSPCPDSSSRTVSDTYNVSGNIVGTGEPVSGTAYGSHRETVPVQSRALSRDDACAALAKNTRTGEKGRNSDSAYERNKMRSDLNCR